jgi:hypothetical protein
MTGAIDDRAKFVAVRVIRYGETATLRVPYRARGGHSCSSTGFARSTVTPLDAALRRGHVQRTAPASAS